MYSVRVIRGHRSLLIGLINGQNDGEMVPVPIRSARAIADILQAYIDSQTTLNEPR